MKKTLDNFWGDKILVVYQGQEKSVADKWLEIVQIEDVDERHIAIDKLLETMQKNAPENGFIRHDEALEVNNSYPCEIYINDVELYYLFFDNLKELYDSNKYQSNDALISISIKKTLDQYFGGYGTNLNERLYLTKSINQEDERVFPSIKDLKGKSLGACVEVAACSHNLWLLTGKHSSYVASKRTKILGTNDGHAFNIVQIKDHYSLYDIVRNILKPYSTNPVDKILNNESFKVGDDYYFVGEKTAETEK